MFIIIENNKITGIERNLLNDLNITLESISEFINTLELQIASLTGSQLNINNKTFNVNEIEMISTKNIKIFQLKESSNSNVKIKEEPSLNPDDLLATPKEDISTEKNSEKENIEEEPTTDSLDFSNQEPLKEPLKHNEINLGKESEEIEISFKDDLDEIKEILELSTAEFNKLIEEELQKASNELGIDIKDLKDWYLQLLEQIQEEKSTIYKNIKKADYDALHKNYHKLKGAALNLRLSKIAIILKKLDELSKDKEDINKIKKITDDFYLLFEHKTKTSSQEKDEITPIKNSFLEKIIIQTIQTYLKTQDEERFKKDKKYIEKVLGQKIESIEDLQKFVKGI